MPRLTRHNYLKLHYKLHVYWQNHQQLFSYLSSTEQYYLHDYFQLSKQLLAVELTKHRKLVTAERPSLPQQAGRALAKLEQHAKNYVADQPPAPGKRTVQRNKDSRITARSVVKPDFDARRYAELIFMFAKWRNDQ